MKMISNLLGAVMEYFGWARKRQELTNSPEMQAAAQARTDAAVQDKATKAVAEGDLDEIRKGAAE